MDDKNKRYPEIDFIKGVACVLMLFGHAIRIHMPIPGTFDKVFLHLMDFSGPIFFFASGMNVVTFLERNRARSDFAARKFYLWSAAAMFFLGFAYNFNRTSLANMEIFQCVAVCTAAVYLFLDTKLSTRAHFFIVAAIYAIYLVFRIRLEQDKIVPDFTLQRYAMLPNMSVAELSTMGSNAHQWDGMSSTMRFWFVHFSPFFWVVFFYVGALCFRSLRARPDRAGAWAVFFGAAFVTGPFVMRRFFGHGASLLDSIFLRNFLELTVRGIPSYVIMTLGGAGLFYLAARRWYPGAAAVRWPVARWAARQMEFLGKESLLFLVVHWFNVSLAGGLVHVVQFVQGAEEPTAASVYLRGTTALVLTLAFMPLLARWRDRWSRTRAYGWQIGTIMCLSLPLAAYLAPRIPGLAYYATFITSFGFAFVYPHLRGKLRKKYTKAAVT